MRTMTNVQGRAVGSVWRIWLAPIMLVFIAGAQIFLAKTAHLSPWKGGGFDMFATIDGSAFRDLRVVVERNGVSDEIPIAPSQENIAARARLHPSDWMLSTLAQAVIRREHRHGRQVTGVRIELWNATFNEHLEATENLIRTFTLQVDQAS